MEHIIKIGRIAFLGVITAFTFIACHAQDPVFRPGSIRSDEAPTRLPDCH